MVVGEKYVNKEIFIGSPKKSFINILLLYQNPKLGDGREKVDQKASRFSKNISKFTKHSLVWHRATSVRHRVRIEIRSK